MSSNIVVPSYAAVNSGMADCPLVKPGFAGGPGGANPLIIRVLPMEKADSATYSAAEYLVRRLADFGVPAKEFYTDTDAGVAVAMPRCGAELRTALEKAILVDLRRHYAGRRRVMDYSVQLRLASADEPLPCRSDDYLDAPAFPSVAALLEETGAPAEEWDDETRQFWQDELRKRSRRPVERLAPWTKDAQRWLRFAERCWIKEWVEIAREKHGIELRTNSYQWTDADWGVWFDLGYLEGYLPEDAEPIITRDKRGVMASVSGVSGTFVRLSGAQLPPDQTANGGKGGAAEGSFAGANSNRVKDLIANGGKQGQKPEREELPKQGDPWEGEPVEGELPVPAFPVDALPSPARRLVRGVAAAMGCGEDLIGTLALTAMAAAIGYSRALKMTNTWTERPIIYSLGVAPPGGMKSPVLAVAKHPLDIIDSELHRKHEEAEDAYRVKLKEWKQREEAAGNGGPDPGRKPTQPVKRGATVDNITSEELARKLAVNQRGLASFQDELLGWFRNMDAYRSGKGGDKQFYMTLWGGGGFKVERKTGDHKEIRANSSQFCIGGCLTPDGLKQLSENAYGSDGFLDRFLPTYPQERELPEWDENRDVPQGVLDHWMDLIVALSQLEGVKKEDKKYPLTLTLSTDAKALWKEWHDRHNQEASPMLMPEGLRSAWSKLKAYCVRLALVVFVARKEYGEVRGDEVDRDSLASAIKLIDYFKGHVRKVHAVVSSKSTRRSDHGKAILKWIKKGNREMFTFAELWDDLKKRFHDGRDEARAELASLRNVVRLIRVPTAPSRKMVETYEVNPSALGGGDAAHPGEPSEAA